ncbi:MAG: hypothetical protein JWN61_2030 [Pseudonocardiales bacterium]|nr:hypothetical protein [Jatrophihabitantaceae bacterium]MCW2603895.1 hypothetical protein [Pseudonocardiales bacterium]
MHRLAIADATDVIAQVRPEDLDKPTPCAGWNLGRLLTHMIGQNHGFAEAIENGDAPASAYSYQWTAEHDLHSAWAQSVERLAKAVDAHELDERITLVEINPKATYPLGAVIGFHTLDTAIHAWDVSTSRNVLYRPNEDLIDEVYARARQVPAGKNRTGPGAAFAPPITVPPEDLWRTALALLGRRG